MNLFPKAIRFILEVLEFRIAAYQEQLKNEDLDDEEMADIGNDVMFLESLSQELKQIPKQLTSQVS